jgi:hypothetical protein
MHLLDIVTRRVLGVGQAVKVVDARFAHSPHDELEGNLKKEEKKKKSIYCERICFLVQASRKVKFRTKKIQRLNGA